MAFAFYVLSSAEISLYINNKISFYAGKLSKLSVVIKVSLTARLTFFLEKIQTIPCIDYNESNQ
jgi:hypothetical protein